MTWIVVDVEATGPAPAPLGSMVSFGAVVVEPGLERTFYGRTAPVCDAWDPKSYDIIGITRAEHMSYPNAQGTMLDFVMWLDRLGERRLTFVSDNPAYDWQWMNWYLHRFAQRNPFGFSARRIGDLYAGWKGNASLSTEWKRLRRTVHTHHPVDDAKGNAEALLTMQSQGLKLPEIRKPS